MKLSIIIPTLGRAALSDLLDSLVPQLAPDDEILVVADGPNPTAMAIALPRAPSVKYLEYGPDHCWGHPQRNHAMKSAVGSHIMSLDDDDLVFSDTLKLVRIAISSNPNRPLMFRMHHEGKVLWEHKEVKIANVSTQMFIAPNQKGRLGVWGKRYEGDFDFIKSTTSLYPDGALVWVPDIIAHHGVGGKSSVPMEDRQLHQVFRAMFHGMAGLASQVGSDMSGHMTMLYLLGRHWSFGEVVEVGVGNGFSTMSLLAGVTAAGRKLISVDLNVACKDITIRNMQLGHEHPTLKAWSFRGQKSIEAASTFNDASISLLFIDSDHTTEYTRKELEAWLPRIHPDGVICGHDYFLHEDPAWATFNVKKAVDEFSKNHADRFQLQTLRHDRGFFILWPKTWWNAKG